MVNKKDFEMMRKELDKREKERDEIIKLSREIVKLTKKVIYSVHRNEIKSANQNLIKLNKKRSKILEITKDNPEHYFSNSFKIAEQEYTEAVCYYKFVKNRDIPSAYEMEVDIEYYLLGICDLTGELVRRAINAAINGDFEEAIYIKNYVTGIYNELMLFEFKNELRRKFDGIKYDLKKLDELALNIKLKIDLK